MLFIQINTFSIVTFLEGGKKVFKGVVVVTIIDIEAIEGVVFLQAVTNRTTKGSHQPISVWRISEGE
jgi:hypothetical protein